MAISSGISTRCWGYFRFSVHNPIALIFHYFDWEIIIWFPCSFSGLEVSWYFEDDLVNSGYEKRSRKDRTLLYRCYMNILSVKVLAAMNFSSRSEFSSKSEMKIPGHLHWNPLDTVYLISSRAQNGRRRTVEGRFSGWTAWPLSRCNSNRLVLISWSRLNANSYWSSAWISSGIGFLVNACPQADMKLLDSKMKESGHKGCYDNHQNSIEGFW